MERNAKQLFAATPVRLGLAALMATGALLIPAAHSPLQADDWVKLGEREVNAQGRGRGRGRGNDDTDTIQVRRRGKFDKIQFRVRGGNIQMDNVVVRFANGRRWSPPTRVNFDRGDQSREINLPGDARDIDSVSFRYNNTSRREATIYLYGRKD